jgi:hypothetical protein
LTSRSRLLEKKAVYNTPSCEVGWGVVFVEEKMREVKQAIVWRGDLKEMPLGKKQGQAALALPVPDREDEA